MTGLFQLHQELFEKHRCFDENFLNILQMNQLCIIFWLSIRNPDSLGWFMRVGKVSKNLKEFLKFFLTKLPIRQEEFLIFPRRILHFPKAYSSFPLHPSGWLFWNGKISPMNQDSALSIKHLRGADSFEGCFHHFQEWFRCSKVYHERQANHDYK